MANYELPWNPNRLEQRIGRIHRYGQDKEVKVWNFLFEDTRESEIFEMLQTKVEEIRSKLGNTADVLGILDDINVDSLIMESIQNDQPPSATKEELEELIEERQRTRRVVRAEPRRNEYVRCRESTPDSGSRRRFRGRLRE